MSDAAAGAAPGAAPIRVFVADDHPMVRFGLTALVAAQPDMRVAGEAGDGHEAVRLIAELAPDVALVDLLMPGLDGLAVIARLRERLPQTRFIMLTSLVDPARARQALNAGASGYLLKTASAAQLASVIRQATHGTRMLSPEISDALIGGASKPLPGNDLTPREREVLTLMSRGRDNQQIADELAVTLATVKYHVTHILSKLGAEHRTAAVLIALRNGIVSGD